MKISQVRQKNNSINFKDRYDAEADKAYSRGSIKGRKDSPTNQENYYYDEDSTTTDESGATTEDEQEPKRKVILEISVTDTGIGMPADRLPRLFKSFSQIDISTARRFGGTGLGLAISSMLVNRMGGGLWVESEEGLGSRFALTLPIEVSTRPVSGTPQTSSDGSIVQSCPPSPSSSEKSLGMVEPEPLPITKKANPLIEPIPQMTVNISKGLRPHKEKKAAKKSMENEETLQLIYPLKILLAEDNVCKYHYRLPYSTNSLNSSESKDCGQHLEKVRISGRYHCWQWSRSPRINAYSYV